MGDISDDCWDKIIDEIVDDEELSDKYLNKINKIK